MVSKVRKILWSSLTGFLLGFFFVAGKELDIYDSLDFLQKMFYVKWILATVISGGVILLLWELLPRCKKYIPDLPFSIPYWGCVVLLFLCWLPALFSLFPGAFSYDALDEWRQVATGNLTAHHPVLHVLLLGGLVEGFHSITGSYNVGIAIYSLLQMVVMANLLAYALQWMRKHEISGVFTWAAFLLCGLSPVLQLYAICATKDVLFTGFELLFFLEVWDLLSEKEQYLNNKKRLLFFGIVSLMTMILRNNGLYIVLIVFVLLGFHLRKCWKKYLCVLCGVLLLYGMYVGPVYDALDVTSGGVEEMLSVPLQQMARVYKYNFEGIEAEDLEYMYQVVPKENWEMYRSTVADYVKDGFRQEVFEQERVKFFSVWLKLGLENPLTYVNSFLVGTVDYWYPFAIIDGYKDYTGKSSFFDYQVDEPGTEIVFLQGLHEWYEELSHVKEAQKTPFLFLLISPGWYLVLWLVAFLYQLCYKKYEQLVPMCILGVHLLTVLLGPIALVRYVLIFYVIAPVVWGMLMKTSELQEKNFLGKS